MELLGIGPMELFFIVILALILLGPKDMVKAGRTIGRLLRKTILSPTWLNIQAKMRNLPYQMMREAGLEEEDLRVAMDLPRVDIPNVSAYESLKKNGPAGLDTPASTPPASPSETIIPFPEPALPQEPAAEQAAEANVENSTGAESQQGDIQGCAEPTITPSVDEKKEQV